MELIGVCIFPGRICSGHPAVPTVLLVYGAQEQPMMAKLLPKNSAYGISIRVYSN